MESVFTRARNARAILESQKDLKWKLVQRPGGAFIQSNDWYRMYAAVSQVRFRGHDAWVRAAQLFLLPSCAAAQFMRQM